MPTSRHKIKNKWILFGVAVTLIAIALVSFLIKTGMLSALIIGIKKLWEKIRKGNR